VRRYKIVPDEVIQYAAGYYGRDGSRPSMPMSGDRILAAPRQEILPQPTGATFNRGAPGDGTAHGRRRTSCCCGAWFPHTDLKRMREAGPIKRVFPLLVVA